MKAKFVNAINRIASSITKVYGLNMGGGGKICQIAIPFSLRRGLGFHVNCLWTRSLYTE